MTPARPEDAWGPDGAGVAKQVSVSLPTEQVPWLDENARRGKASRRSVREQALEARRQQWAALFAEGCREFADDMKATAADTLALQAEVVLREPFDIH